MNSLSTHVLNLSQGVPAAGVSVCLWAGEAMIFAGATNADGRCPELPTLESGRYRLEFAVAAYFRAEGVALAEPPFLDLISIDFGIAAAGGHYHVPLLVSPFGYSTYRGS